MNNIFKIVIQALMRGLISAKSSKTTKNALVLGTVVAVAAGTSAYIDSKIPVMAPDAVTASVNSCEALKLEPIYHLKADKVSVMSIECVEPTSTAPRTVVDANIIESVVTDVVQFLTSAATQG